MSAQFRFLVILSCTVVCAITPAFAAANVADLPSASQTPLPEGLRRPLFPLEGQFAAKVFAPRALQARAARQHLAAGSESPLAASVLSSLASPAPILQVDGAPKAGGTVNAAKYADFASLAHEPRSIFPGALVQIDAGAFSQALPTPLEVNPGSGNVAVLLAGFQADQNMRTQAHVDHADAPGIDRARHDLLAQHMAALQSAVTLGPYRQVYSAADARLALGAPFVDGNDAAATAFFKNADAAQTNHVLFVVREPYYALAYTPDGASPADFFTHDTAAATFQHALNGAAAPAFMSTVTYGTAMYGIADAVAAGPQIIDAVSTALGSLQSLQPTKLTATQRSLINAMTVHVVTVGSRARGNPEPTYQTISGGDVAGKLLASATANFDFAGQALNLTNGVPIDYTVHYLDYVPLYIDGIAHINAVSVPTVSATTVQVLLGVTDLAKTAGTGVHVSVIGSDGSVAADTQVTPGNATQSQYAWAPHSKHQLVLHLAKPIPLYDLANTQLYVDASGQPWHGDISASVHDANDAEYPSFLAPVPLAFNDASAGVAGGTGRAVSTYCFTLQGPMAVATAAPEAPVDAHAAALSSPLPAPIPSATPPGISNRC